MSDDETAVLIGAPNDAAPAAESGSAYLFKLDNFKDLWAESGQLLASDGKGGAKFGTAVRLVGDTALVGATRGGNPGATYVFSGFVIDDCNDNGVADVCDVIDGSSRDINSDGVPDECMPPADLNGDGDVTVADLIIMIQNWGACAECPPACLGDLDGDCVVATDDLLMLVSVWE